MHREPIIKAARDEIGALPCLTIFSSRSPTAQAELCREDGRLDCAAIRSRKNSSGYLLAQRMTLRGLLASRG
jgi:hypothetical protein